MTLLIAILLKLGFIYTPAQISASNLSGPSEEIIHAQQIIDNNRYHYDEDGGVVIEDDVDPVN